MPKIYVWNTLEIVFGAGRVNASKISETILRLSKDHKRSDLQFRINNDDDDGIPFVEIGYYTVETDAQYNKRKHWKLCQLKAFIEEYNREFPESPYEGQQQ